MTGTTDESDAFVFFGTTGDLAYRQIRSSRTSHTRTSTALIRRSFRREHGQVLD
jgi:hypothetical protein